MANSRVLDCHRKQKLSQMAYHIPGWLLIIPPISLLTEETPEIHYVEFIDSFTSLIIHHLPGSARRGEYCSCRLLITRPRSHAGHDFMIAN